MEYLLVGDTLIDMVCDDTTIDIGRVGVTVAFLNECACFDTLKAEGFNPVIGAFKPTAVRTNKLDIDLDLAAMGYPLLFYTGDPPPGYTCLSDGVYYVTFPKALKYNTRVVTGAKTIKDFTERKLYKAALAEYDRIISTYPKSTAFPQLIMRASVLMFYVGEYTRGLVACNTIITQRMFTEAEKRLARGNIKFYTINLSAPEIEVHTAVKQDTPSEMDMSWCSIPVVVVSQAVQTPTQLLALCKDDIYFRFVTPTRLSLPFMLGKQGGESVVSMTADAGVCVLYTRDTKTYAKTVPEGVINALFGF